MPTDNPYSELPTTTATTEIGPGLPIGAVLTRGVVTWVSCAGPITLLTVGIAAPMVGLEFLLARVVTDIQGLTLSTVTLQFLQICLLTPALVHVTSAHLDGRSATLGEALRFAFSRFWATLVVRFSVSLRVSLACLALLVPGLYLMVRYALTDVIVALEPGADALARSRDLVQGRMLQVFVIGGAAWLGPFLVGMGAQALVGAVGGDGLVFVGRLVADVLLTFSVVTAVIMTRALQRPTV